MDVPARGRFAPVCNQQPNEPFVPLCADVAAQRCVFDVSEDIFSNPEEFNPDREEVEYTVPSTGKKMKNTSIWGFGPYKCLGKRTCLKDTNI